MMDIITEAFARALADKTPVKRADLAFCEACEQTEVVDKGASVSKCPFCGAARQRIEG